MPAQTHPPVVLMICDGWGELPASPGNAIAQARTANFDQLRAHWPHTTLAASGEAVGLPEGQIGNSEVGHLTIGMGRVTRQALVQQKHEIKSGSFYQNEVLIQAIEIARERGSSLHLLGLVSPGGVHSHSDGALAVVKLAKQLGLTRVFIHAFTDGRDVPPASAADHIVEFEAELAAIGNGRIASMSGRYYAMDRDNRWDRIQLAYDVLVGAAEVPRTADTPAAHLVNQYSAGQTDEFIHPVAITDQAGNATHLADNDVVVFFNFRADRARQLSHALVDPKFTGFTRSKVLHNLHFVSFTDYNPELSATVAFPAPSAGNSLAEVISRAGLQQYHIAETEKYAHVTYFLNGGTEAAFPHEVREMVPSVKVATYDLEPAMSATIVADRLIERLKAGQDAFLVANFANADMVGHSGILSSAIAAIETLDSCLGRVRDAVLAANGVMIMTADHGNAEAMLDADGLPRTAHTTSPVPVLIVGAGHDPLPTGRGLEDIAPTILDLMHLSQPTEMTGRSLLKP